MLLGLGERGTEVASQCYQFIKLTNALISEIVGGIGIAASGNVSRLSDETSLFTFQDLADAKSLNPYESNYEAFVRREEQIRDILVSHFESLIELRFSQELEDAGYDVKTENLQVFVFAPSFDLLGSAITIPLLRILEVMKQNRRIPKGTQLSLFVFLPDLSGTPDGELKRIEMARMFQFLSELDYELDVALVNQDKAQLGVGLTWLVGGINENNNQVGKFDEVLSVVTSTVASMVAYPLLSDQSFRHILLTKLQHRGRFYSSFGSSRIIFPEKEILDLLCSYAVGELLKPLVADLKGGQFDRSLVFEGCRDFLSKQHLKSLIDLLSKDETGNGIYRDFCPPIPKEEEIVPSLFYTDVENKFKEFSERVFNEYTVKLSTQSQTLLDDIVKALEQMLSTNADADNKGMGYDVALLRSLQGQDSMYLRGDSLELSHTVDEIEKPVRSFYKAMLGLDAKEGSLDRLDAQIKAKDRRLSEYEKELDRISKRLERVESPADSERFNLDKVQIQENSKAIASERAKLVNEFENLKSDIEALNLHIDDLQERMILKDEAEGKSEGGVQEAKANLEKTDKALKEAQIQLKALASLRRKIFWRLTAAIPACFSVVVLLSGFFLSYFGILRLDKFLGFILSNWDWCFVIIVVYAFVAFLYFERKVGRQFRETGRLVHDLRNRKKSNMVDLVNAFNGKAIVRWKHLVYNQALMWTKGFREGLFQTTGEMERFIQQLQEALQSALNAWNTKNLPNSLSKKSVLTKNELIDTFYEKSPPSLEKFFRKKPLSSYMIDYLHQQKDGSLEDGLRQFLSQEFIAVGSKSVEDFIFPEGPGNHTVASVYIEPKIRSLFRSAAPLCHLDVDADKEKAAQKVAICVKDKEKSQVPQLMDRLFGSKRDDFNSTGDKNALEINRFTIGFPLFQVSQLRSAQACHKELCESDEQRGFSIDSTRYRGYSPFPETFVDRELADEKRKLIFEAELFGFLKRDSQRRFVFPGDPTPRDESELMKFLESFKGRSVRHDLEEMTSNAKNEQPKECIAKALHFLAQESGEKASQLVEMMMAKKLLEELNPLA